MNLWWHIAGCACRIISGCRSQGSTCRWYVRTFMHWQALNYPLNSVSVQCVIRNLHPSIRLFRTWRQGLHAGHGNILEGRHHRLRWAKGTQCIGQCIIEPVKGNTLIIAEHTDVRNTPSEVCACQPCRPVDTLVVIQLCLCITAWFCRCKVVLSIVHNNQWKVLQLEGFPILLHKE